MPAVLRQTVQDESIGRLAQLNVAVTDGHQGTVPPRAQREIERGRPQGRSLVIVTGSNDHHRGCVAGHVRGTGRGSAMWVNSPDVIHLRYVDCEAVPDPGRHSESCAYCGCGHHGHQAMVFHPPEECPYRVSTSSPIAAVRPLASA